MPATITGTVFHDLNHNGQFDPGEAGIANVMVTLHNITNNTCVQTATNSNGSYRFSVSTAGTYHLFAASLPTKDYPPTACPQPDGFICSNGARVLSVTVTDAQITHNTIIAEHNFSRAPLDRTIPCSAAAMCLGAVTDLDVTLTASPDPVRPGDRFTYTITMTNPGTLPAQHVILTDTVPAGLLDAEYAVGGTVFRPWPGALSLGTLAPGESKTIFIRGTIAPTATESIANTVVVSFTAPNGDPANNSATITTPICEAAADIAVNLTASPDPVAPGERLTYTVIITNQGPAPTQTVILTDTVPAGLLDAEYAANGAAFRSWPGALSLGTLAPGESKTIFIRGTIAPTATECIANTAAVTSATPDPFSANNSATVTVTVREAADLSVVKTANTDHAAPNGTITYTIVVTDQGPSAAQAVTLTDSIPSGLFNAQYSMNGTTFKPWPGTLSLGTLTPGESATIFLRAAIASTATASLTNTAVVTSTTPDPFPTNNTSTIIVPIGDARCQAITDLIESTALEEAALAHILNAEGEKLQAIIALSEATPSLLLQANRSVRSMTSAIALLETLLASKLSLITNCTCGDL